MNKISALCVMLIAIPSQLQAQAITGDIPYAKKLLDENDNTKLKVWTMSEIRNDKTETIKPGGSNTMEKDIRSVPSRLGYHSLDVEKDENAKEFSGELDLTNAVLPAKIAILVDDIADLKVKEIERKAGVDGPVFEDKFEVKGTALWNPRSYKEFSTHLPPGRKYKLDLIYSNTANLTQKYGGKVDVDGVSVYVSLLPVEINEVGFAGSNYHELKSDDGKTTYNAPHWVDANKDGTAVTSTGTGDKNYPVAFTRNTKPKLEGKFKITGLANGQNVKIKANSAQGLEIPETEVKIAADGTFTLPLTESLSNLVDSIQLHNADDNTAFVINWAFRTDSVGWSSIGSTKHTVYITMADPIKTAIGLKRESLFNIGCRNGKKAAGATAHAVVDAIYDDFKDRDVQRAKPSSGSLDGNSMKYWNNPPTAGFATTDLLSSGDGRCGAWTRMFTDILRTQGIDAQITAFYAPAPNMQTLQTLVPAINAKYPNYQGQVNVAFGNPPQLQPVILVKNWNLGNVFAPIDNKGIEGQGNPDPQSFFGDHFVVQYNGQYYDPSYGSNLFATQQAWEDAALDGFGLFISANPALPDLAQTNPALPNGVTIWMWKADPKGSVETILQPVNY